MGSFLSHDQRIPEQEKIIAVMGMTGSGKSSLVREITKDGRIEIGHGLASETQEIAAYSVDYNGIKYTLVDTIGFDDTTQSNDEVAESILNWLAKSYRAGTTLDGVLYLHRITDVKMSGSAHDNLKMFRELCGGHVLRNVVLCTTFWDQVDPSLGARREQQLLTDPDFWARMIEEGATTQRIVLGDRTNILQVLEQIASWNDKVVLQSQKEMVDQGKAAKETEAAKSALQEFHRQKRKELDAKKAAMDEEIQRKALESQRAIEAEKTRIEKQRLERQKRVEDIEKQTKEAQRKLEECQQDQRQLEAYQRRIEDQEKLQRQREAGTLRETSSYSQHSLPPRPNNTSQYLSASSTYGDVSSTYNNPYSAYSKPCPSYGNGSSTYSDISSTYGNTSSPYRDASSPYRDASSIYGDTSSTYYDTASPYSNRYSAPSRTLYPTYGNTSSIYSYSTVPRSEYPTYDNPSPTYGDASSTYGVTRSTAGYSYCSRVSDTPRPPSPQQASDTAQYSPGSSDYPSSHTCSYTGYPACGNKYSPCKGPSFASGGPYSQYYQTPRPPSPQQTSNASQYPPGSSDYSGSHYLRFSSFLIERK